MKRDLVVIGEANPDLVASGLDALPRLGTEILCQEFGVSLGGSSALVAAGAARLGLSVGFITRVGDDLFGRFVREELAKCGLDLAGLVVDPSVRTGVGLILSLPTDRAIVTFLGSISGLPAELIDLDYVFAHRHLHVSSFFLQDLLRPSVASLFARAREAGLTTSLDTGFDPKEEWDGGLRDVLAQADLFLPNEVEATGIAGASDPEEAAVLLSQMVAGTVAVKMGARGAVAAANGRLVHHPGFRVPVVDTTGAGDAFDAGFLAAFLRGECLESCLAMGCACGALSVTAMGGIAAQATLEQATRLVATGHV
jgi:sugar/nucleoside kinase (ribokinase family)